MAATVWTNGAYDSLHAGHINTFARCRALAGRRGKVIVGLDTDRKITIDKGPHRPLFEAAEREKHIKSLFYPCESMLLDMVDDVVFFNSNEQLYGLIKQYRPDFIVKGSNWRGNVIGSDLAEVILVDLHPNISTTQIEDRILRSEKYKK